MESPRSPSHPRRDGELIASASALVNVAGDFRSFVIWLSFLLDPRRLVWIAWRMESHLEALLETPRDPLWTRVASGKTIKRL